MLDVHMRHNSRGFVSLSDGYARDARIVHRSRIPYDNTHDRALRASLCVSRTAEIRNCFPVFDPVVDFGFAAARATLFASKVFVTGQLGSCV